MLAHQENVTRLAISKLIVNANGSLTNLFDANSSMPDKLPVAVVQQQFKSGRIQQEARLHPEAIGFQAACKFRFLSIDNAHANLIYSSDFRTNQGFVLTDFHTSLERFITRAKDSDAPKLLALRYVRNITSGQWLKSNKIDFGERLSITVEVKSAYMQEDFKFVDHEVHRFGYENFDANEHKIADYLARCLKGEQKCSLSISANLYGDQHHIYASENPTPSKNEFYLMQNKACPETIVSYPFPITGESLLFDKELRGEVQSIDTWDKTANRKSKRLSMRKDELVKSLFNLDAIDPMSDVGLQLLANIIHGFSVPIPTTIQ